MAEHSHIEWTEATWNPIAGCSVVSPGCTNCYAMRRVAPRLAANPATPHYAGTVKPSKAGPVWTGKIGIASDRVLTAPLRWTKPRRIFVNSTSDLFHEDVPDAVIDRIFAVMALCRQHTFQVLTKRSARMRDYVNGFSCDGARRFNIADAAGRIMEDGDNAAHEVANAVWPLPNVWLGISAEDQPRWDERTSDLKATPSSVRFVSAEPLIGPIVGDMTKLDWIIVGGESGSGARPMHPDWARSIRDQCAAAGTAFFFKQWGNFSTVIDRDRDDPDWRRDYRFAYSDDKAEIRWLNLKGGRGFHGERFHIMRDIGKKAAGRLLDGVEHNATPVRP